jgi:hypothetical protein
MRKRARHFQEIEEYKERFRGLPTEKLIIRLMEHGSVLALGARSAIKQLLKERGHQSETGLHPDAES